jgi:hypothetical protein
VEIGVPLATHALVLVAIKGKIAINKANTHSANLKRLFFITIPL